jgi:hypothetical protein
LKLPGTIAAASALFRQCGGLFKFVQVKTERKRKRINIPKRKMRTLLSRLFLLNVFLA